jgi:CubicO group peptidase (beta-lactamase class C family)
MYMPMNRCRLQILCVALFVLTAPVLAAQAAAQTPVRVEPRGTTPEAQIDRLLSAYNHSNAPGAVVGVVRNGELVFVKGYGMANLEYDVPNTVGTIFHMASVSKQFAAFAVAMLAQEGKLSLDDDIRKHLPEMHDFGTPVTVRHLIHHTSGLRDQWTLWSMAGGRMDDVITHENLLALAQRQTELNFAPGSEHLYSNTGYSLIAEIVARVTGQTFGEWMRATVFEPLGMRQTQIYDDHERIVKQRAYSYQQGLEGGYRKSVLSYANQGATSLFTTAGDLARWLGNFHTGQVGGPALIEQMQERGVLTSGDTITYAFGITVDEHRGLRRLQHGGADAGYRTMVAYYPELAAGVVVLSNVASFDVGGTARALAEAFFAEEMPAPLAASTPVQEVRPTARPARGVGAVSTALLDRYAGTYQIEGGPMVTFTRRGNALFTQVVGQPELPLAAQTDSTFAIEGVEARVTFHREPDGRVLRATAHQNGTHTLRRIERWSPSAAELEGYAGRYFSPELETFYTLAVEEGALFLHHRRHGTFRLSPVERDGFRGMAWFLEDVKFERGEDGRVAGLRVSSGRVRGLRFGRQD